MGEAVEVWRGSVAMWECDAMGHLNVGFYVAKAMEGLAGLAAELGMAGAFAPDARATLIVRDQHIRFLREARPGAPLVMSGGVVELGESEARLLLLLRHRSGELAASFQTVVAHATARDGRAFPWPARVRERARALTLEVPPEAAARSIGLEPVQSRAGRRRADELGLPRTALGAVGAGDCDLFGRMRTELMMARISDAIPHLFEGRRPGAEAAGARIGGAALEYRLIHLDWPRAGDRVELRSGASGGDARFRRLTHWLLDPESGKAWGVAEAIAVSFDLETRKMITLSAEALAEADARVIPGLTL
ncbi:MAG TPA: thioesterase family protein [Phenylobacterium sp.]|uniref:thioesterase family protein n=1 Tax=Phenylobacterium sp. TaxID=1871053 RepID=UPI002D19A2F6|nr:thioesterase family protein [Phenylobacterium sp.]HXA39394.1 thioesterase family protein [Phenylobacterium sp.]